MFALREFRIPPILRYGFGVSRDVGMVAKALGVSRVLLITDAFMRAGEACAAILTDLRAAGLEVAVYDGVNAEPELRHVDEGLALQREQASQAVLALGGGSPLDAAKAVACMATNPGTIAAYKGQGKLNHPGLPLVAIPTTAGTGSEATQFTIITDPARDEKMLIGSPYLLPRVALVDPELTLGMPRPLTAATGLDALTHAIEAYVSRKAQPMSDVMALSAVRLLGAHLAGAWRDGTNREARARVMLGALQAGIAFSNASVCLVHGMSRPLGAFFHIPHGVSNAVLLGLGMEFSLPGAPERYADIALALGVAERESAEATARAGMETVQALIRELEVPSCGQLGISRDDLDRHAAAMAEAALASGSPANNPRIPDREEIISLYYQAL